MKVLLDTNIILDAFGERQPYDADAKEILLRIQNNRFKGYITANAVADIFYLYSKAKSNYEARTVLSFLFKKLHIISITHEDCVDAMSIPISDFEDSLFVACSIKESIDYVITRDKELPDTSAISNVMSPDCVLLKVQ